jgi:hypothetical protein
MLVSCISSKFPMPLPRQTPVSCAPILPGSGFQFASWSAISAAAMAYCVYFAIRRCSPRESQPSGFHSPSPLPSLFVDVLPSRELFEPSFEATGTSPATLLGIALYSSVSGVLTSPLFALIKPRHVCDKEAPSGVMALRPVTTTRRIGCSSYCSVDRVARCMCRSFGTLKLLDFKARKSRRGEARLCC